MSSESLIPFFERSLTEWAANESTTIASGDWRDGAVMELVGATRLLPARYDGCFEGVRELRTDGSDHHAHIDLGRIHSIEYAIAPSVCLGFRPALEVRYLCVGPGGSRTGKTMVRCLVDALYDDAGVKRSTVDAWYRRYVRDVAEHSDRVRLVLSPELAKVKEGQAFLEALSAASGVILPSWSAAGRLLTEAETSPAAPDGPIFRALIEDAIALREASLVIFRDRTLVEFKTDELNGVYESKEGDHVSWQIGETDGHHCHLSLNAVTQVEFSAEPVSCQGNRLNYTIWFLVPGGCGNPFRSDGYFSFTLNRPYAGGEPRPEVIRPVFDLYEAYREHAWVGADEGFLGAMPGVPVEAR